MKAVAIKQYLRQHRDLRNRVFSKNPVSGGQVSHFLVDIFIWAKVLIKETIDLTIPSPFSV